MRAAALRIELRIPDVRSLKEKRHRVKSVMSRLSHSFPVGVAEVGFHDQWQRTTIGAALVAADQGRLERVIHMLQRSLLEHADVELIEIGVSYMEES